MSTTNFTRLTDHEKKAWSLSFWRDARNNSFFTKLMGDEGAPVHRVRELTKSAKGTRAIITLLPDAKGDGVAGDRTLEGNEEELGSYEDMIRIDQLRHAHGNEGRMADQRTIVNFRKQARNTLAHWIADRTDQLAILTASGISYTKHCDGRDRVGSDLPYLDFAQDVSPPTGNRHLRWDVNGGSDTLVAGNTAAVAADDLPSYKMIVKLRTVLQNMYIKPARDGKLGVELYHMFVTPDGMEAFKLDPDFHAAVRDAMPRSPNNPIFKGFDTVYIDGFAIHNQRYVYNTRGAPAGSKWGDGNVDGQRILVLGAQGLAYADIGAPYWVEEEYDYQNRHSISCGKIFGFKKPKFKTDRTGTVEDFSAFVVDTAI
jgi:N4-gp56 family major capsid protein